MSPTYPHRKITQEGYQKNGTVLVKSCIEYLYENEGFQMNNLQIHVCYCTLHKKVKKRQVVGLLNTAKSMIAGIVQLQANDSGCRVINHRNSQQELKEVLKIYLGLVPNALYCSRLSFVHVGTRWHLVPTALCTKPDREWYNCLYMRYYFKFSFKN